MRHLPSKLSLIALNSLILAGCFAGGRDGQPIAEPSQADAGAPGPKPPSPPSTPLACSVIDAELQLNCDIDLACAGFSGEEQTCISDVMALDWSRPPCEEYAACLDIPLFDCVDVDQELSLNCGIDSQCQQMSWGERFCISGLMNMDWSQPPCEQYSQCLQLD